MANLLKTLNEIEFFIKITPIEPVLINDNRDRNEDDSNNINYFFREWKRGKEPGDICIPGSTIRGAFYSLCQDIVMANEGAEDNLNVFGDEENKSRVSFDDSFIFSNDEEFFSENTVKPYNGEIEKVTNIAIDRFTMGNLDPYKKEYISDRNFYTKFSLKNFSTSELGMFSYALRDFMKDEIRIGNSKSRGFGKIHIDILKISYKEIRNNFNEESCINGRFYIESQGSDKDDSIEYKDEFKFENENKKHKYDFSDNIFIKKTLLIEEDYRNQKSLEGKIWSFLKAASEKF